MTEGEADKWVFDTLMGPLAEYDERQKPVRAVALAKYEKTFLREDPLTADVRCRTAQRSGHAIFNDMQWVTALDKDAQRQERMDIADQVLTDLAKGEEGLGRSKAHKVKRHALRRAAKRLRLVRDGEWGFIDLSKEAFKAAFPGIAVAGGRHSCGQDALIAGARLLGIPVNKAAVYHATLPADGGVEMDSKIDAVVSFATDELGLGINNLNEGSNALSRRPGGAQQALLRDVRTGGPVIVELEVEGDKHAVLYIPSTAGVCIDVLELESIDPGAVSLILDNDPRIPVKYIYENDSSSPGKARDVFSSLFPGRVWMKNAFQMTADEEHVKKVKETRAAREAAQALVGRHVRVWWAGDNVWYVGSIVSFDNVSTKHTVSYEDGDLRAHNLLEAGVETWELH